MIATEDLNKIRQLWPTAPGAPLTAAQFQPLHGTDLLQFDLPLCADTEEARLARAILNILLSGYPVQGQLLQQLTPSIILGMSGELAKALHEEVKQRCLALTEHLLDLQNTGELTDDQRLSAQCQLNNILDYGAQFGFEVGDTVTLPYFEADGRVSAVLYQVEKIKLTSDKISSPYPCYGFTPILPDCKASSHLVFKSTTYPGSEGFAWALTGDMTPGMAIGEPLFYLGRDIIEAWLESQKSTPGKAGTIVHGHSLGASMAIFTADAFGDLVDKAFAYGPAGAYREDLDGSKVVITFGGSDHVPLLGHMPRGATYVYAITDGDLMESGEPQYGSYNSLLGKFASHAIGLPCAPQVKLFIADGEYMIQNHANRRTVQNLHTLAKAVTFPVVVAGQALTSVVTNMLALGRHLISSFTQRPQAPAEHTSEAVVHPVAKPESLEENPNPRFAGLFFQRERQRASSQSRMVAPEPCDGGTTPPIHRRENVKRV